MTIKKLAKTLFGQRISTPSPVLIVEAQEATPTPVPTPEPGVAEMKPVPKPKMPKPASLPADTLTAKHLKDALALATSVVARRISLPILSCVRVGEGRIEATDLEQRLTITLPGLDFAPVCAPLKMFREFTRNLKGDVCLRAEGQTLIVNETFRILGFDPAEWPNSTEQPSVWPGHFMLPPKSHWEAVMTAMSPDETRPRLCGVCLDIENRRFVATDGHRLHAVDAQVNALKPNRKGSTRPKTVIIPALAVKTLHRMLPDRVVGALEYFVHKTQKKDGTPGETVVSSWILRFSTLTATLTVRLPETADFPDYTQIIPEPSKTTAVTFPRLSLLEAARACRAVYTASGENREISGMALEPSEGGIKGWAEQPNSGRVERVIPAQGWPSHVPGVGFNSRYLMEALSCLQEDSVTLQITDHEHPVSIYEGPIMMVIMPMRIFPGKVEETAVLKSDEKDLSSINE